MKSETISRSQSSSDIHYVYNQDYKNKLLDNQCQEFIQLVIKCKKTLQIQESEIQKQCKLFIPHIQQQTPKESIVDFKFDASLFNRSTFEINEQSMDQKQLNIENFNEQQQYQIEYQQQDSFQKVIEVNQNENLLETIERKEQVNEQLENTVNLKETEEKQFKIEQAKDINTSQLFQATAVQLPLIKADWLNESNIEIFSSDEEMNQRSDDLQITQPIQNTTQSDQLVNIKQSAQSSQYIDNEYKLLIIKSQNENDRIELQQLEQLKSTDLNNNNSQSINIIQQPLQQHTEDIVNKLIITNKSSSMKSNSSKNICMYEQQNEQSNEQQNNEQKIQVTDIVVQKDSNNDISDEQVQIHEPNIEMLQEVLEQIIDNGEQQIENIKQTTSVSDSQIIQTVVNEIIDVISETQLKPQEEVSVHVAREDQCMDSILNEIIIDAMTQSEVQNLSCQEQAIEIIVRRQAINKSASKIQETIDSSLQNISSLHVPIYNSPNLQLELTQLVDDLINSAVASASHINTRSVTNILDLTDIQPEIHVQEQINNQEQIQEHQLEQNTLVLEPEMLLSVTENIEFQAEIQQQDTVQFEPEVTPANQMHYFLLELQTSSKTQQTDLVVKKKKQIQYVRKPMSSVELVMSRNTSAPSQPKQKENALKQIFFGKQVLNRTTKSAPRSRVLGYAKMNVEQLHKINWAEFAKGQNEQIEETEQIMD
ncbi:Hypothetical_protein [Hexamita inflata]|uniref:Hypothetical_protein n=1 Tax=Hexamita inflata TaxID=28002 RepID=A0AA86UDE1_9EUKA|nr:Hypothetical protein HINF_LOCUS24993 [Hexamita inflata]